MTKTPKDVFSRNGRTENTEVFARSANNICKSDADSDRRTRRRKLSEGEIEKTE